MNRIDLMTILTAFCVFFAVVGAEARAPSSNVLARKIRQKPITKHTDLYIQLSDTMMRESRPLQEALIKTGREDWYGKYIRGLKLEHVEKMDVESTFSMSRGLSMYRTLMLNVRNKRTIDLWIKLLANSPVSSADVKHEAPPWLKRMGPSFLRVLIREIAYNPKQNGQKNQRDAWSSNRELRYLSSVGPIPRIAFEASVFHEDELDEGLKNRLDDFSWQILETKNQLNSWKVFGVAYLSNNGISRNRIENVISVSDIHLQSGGVIDKESVKQDIFSKAGQWINQYPKWPIDESNLDDDRHKNQQGEGHEKQKGKGH